MQPDVSIVTSGHDVSDARLHRVCAALLREGLDVEVRGLGAAGDGPEGAAVHATPRGSLLRRPLVALRHAGAARGRVLVALDPDSLLAALVVARGRRRRVVADVHEDYAALLRDRPWARGWRGRLAGVVAGLATRAATASDLVVVADEHVPPRRAPRRLVLRNLPDPAMLPPPGVRDGQPRALYVGDVRGSRGLWAMLEALRLAEGWSLDVVGPVARADADRLEGLLRERALSARVRLHGRMPPRRSWELARGAWCGLALLEDTPAFRSALPSKLYEYLACGLPVVVTDLPRQAGLVRESGAGVVVPAGAQVGPATARALATWRHDAESLEQASAAARAWRSAVLDGSEYSAVAREVAALAR